MDLKIIEKELYAKMNQVRIKGKTVISYNLYNGINEQLKKLHNYEEMKKSYENMYKSNIEMSDKLTEINEQLRKANLIRSKTKIGLMEKQIKSALKYLDKATWIDTREKNDLINILGEKYDRSN